MSGDSSDEKNIMISIATIPRTIALLRLWTQKSLATVIIC